MQKTFEQCVARYGAIDQQHMSWPNATLWLSNLEIPEEIGENWINTATGEPVKHIYCNIDMHEPLLEALHNVYDRELLSELKTFDGCWNIRPVRGTLNEPSVHSYGLAIDISAAENKLGDEPSLSQEFVKCFTDAGFSWGGEFRRKDGMHFSFAWE